MKPRDRETPLTDAAEIDNSDFADWGTGPSGYVEVDFARRLEQERDAAVEALKKIAEGSNTWEFADEIAASVLAEIEGEKG